MMIYSNSTVRRQDRLLDEQSADRLLIKGEYGILSMHGENGGLYAVPINYAWDGQESIYFHCAPEGRKLRCLDSCNTVSFCIVGRTNVVSEKFTTEYESLVLEGKAYRNLPDDERMKALELILDKYSPNDKAIGMKYAEKSFRRTEIVRLDIDRWSGKCKIS
ncbi:pyridoxamine 5'-phosphate oxidase family protein [Gaoshiqia sp. Z1-71]|uniref:pyridoxamine 5'-phosphate oxidase family protein n=1 Tax=Gaoshiqia hydrogeniformans TaxID=3290090 RepID=UPI003BF8B5C9